jgi:hypothetical protein
MTTSHWKPPENPRPSEILHSAVRDTEEGFHDRALAKFLWYHKNALKFQQGQGGVRLSFALGYWLDLATVYPPARDGFIRARNEAEVGFLDDTTDGYLFHDLAAMNGRLGQGIRTANIFLHIAERDRVAAKRIYQLAEPSLIAAGQFRACGPFLDSQRRVEMAAECYRIGQEVEASRASAYSAPAFARGYFIEDVATLVSLLVINNRKEEARAAYDAALQTIDDEAFRRIMDAALAGHLPEQTGE